ncbi:MAG TPA: AMP-binding protein [Bacteroidales bacterium]|nr:AMP-binding protein [Bacteroidales bacterium]
MGLENFLYDRITEADTNTFSLLDVLNYRVSNTPDEIAFIYLKDGESDEERITYRELGSSASGLARRMMEMNVAGKRALLLFPPGLEFIKSLMACFYASVIAFPAYPPRKNRSLDRIMKIVTDSEATTVITTTEIYQSFNRSFSDLTELRSLEWIVFRDNPDLHENLESYIPKKTRQVDPHSSSFPDPDSVALLQYTSGSTGNPKGVMITHRNIMRNCEFIRNSFGFSRKTVAVSWLPTFHDMGLVGQIFEPVYTGFPSVLMSPVSFFQKPVRWLRAITKYSGTMGGAPNFAYDLLTESVTAGEKQELDLSSLKTIYCGAEPIRKSTFDNFFNAYKAHGLREEMLYPCYGMAETTLITTGPPAGRRPIYLAVDGESLKKNKVRLPRNSESEVKCLVSVGFPWLDMKIRIVDPETLTPCMADEVGEIWISGSSVSPGYWNKAEINREVFQARLDDDPGTNYLRSGDLGFLHEGELYVSGRLKDMIIIYGRNIYPQDIEFIAENSHPALRQNSSAAFSVEVNGEEKLVIVAEVERSAIIGLDVDAVCDSIRENVALETELAVHAIQLLRTASILKTSSGKIQRRACMEAFLNKTLDVVGESYLESQYHTDEPDDTTVDIVRLEAWLMSWIHEKLKVPLNRIDASRPITAYGLTSMKAIVLQQDFMEKFGVSFPPYLFFEKNSLKQLCEKALKVIEEA